MRYPGGSTPGARQNQMVCARVHDDDARRGQAVVRACRGGQNQRTDKVASVCASAAGDLDVCIYVFRFVVSATCFLTMSSMTASAGGVHNY